MSHRSVAALLAATILIAPAQAAPRHAMTVADLDGLHSVSGPQLDPTGKWVAYTVRSVDAAEDKSRSHIWMAAYDGSREVQLTSRAKESESNPRWSPDGTRLAFLSARDDDHDRSRLWLLDRAGGEARQVGDVTGSIVDLAWAPDAKTIALIVADPDPDEQANAAAGAVAPQPSAPGAPPVSPSGVDTAAKPAAAPAKGDDKRPKPIVIDRFQFMQDRDGYLRTQRQRLWLLDLATGKARRLTTGDYDEALPAWSPDGKRIAFVSKRLPDPDRSYDSNVFAVTVGTAPADPVAITHYAGADNDPERGSYPAWSPDGRQIAYVQGGPVKLIAYGVHTLAVAPADGSGPARVLTPTLDRNVANPVWSADGRSIAVAVEDDGAQRIVRVPLARGDVMDIAGGRQVFDDLAGGPAGRLVATRSTPLAPAEVYAIDKGGLRALSHRNDAWLANLSLATVSETRFKSRDGTEVHGFVATPPGAAATPNRAVLRIHGGPQSQFDLRFDPEWQLLAGHGLTVIAANPRGSTGRGEAYASAIYANWGSVDVEDELAAVDDAVARGVADPQRLGIGGWSYGSMLTQYTIARDPRFKAAIAGAGIVNVIAGYGNDQYIRDYEIELGKPWEAPAVWSRISYPFLHNETITTPTLFMGGEKDFNVPIHNVEQMYQALKSRGLDTELVIYPGEFHGFTRPSFIRDRYQRYLAWYDKRL